MDGIILYLIISGAILALVGFVVMDRRIDRLEKRIERINTQFWGHALKLKTRDNGHD